MELRTFEDAERYLDGFINRERTGVFDYRRLGLGRIRALLDAIGHPEAGLPCIHVAGSKGKGCVALAAEALLAAAGVRAGTYTSPHLETWRERFRVDGAPVSEAALVGALRRVQPALERLRADPELRPSFFDVTTALGLALFREAGVDAGVIEVGIGGRIDSTNVVESRASAITSIQLEHTDKLGDTLEAIALEKAGIARPGVPLVHGPLPPEAYAAVVARAVAEDVPLTEARAVDLRADEKGLRFRLLDGRPVASGVLGAHQAHNLAVAVAAVERFLDRELAPSELAALTRLELPARVERVGDTVIDSAHTPDSARALREALETLWPGRPWVLAVSISRDKDAASILRELAAPARACVLAKAEPDKSLEPEALEPLARAAGIARVEVRREPRAALARARELARPGDLLVLTGSMYFAGALRGLVRAGVDSTGRIG